MDDRQQRQEEEETANEVYASCSFADLGLHPAICEQLRGAYFSVCVCVLDVFRKKKQSFILSSG